MHITVQIASPTQIDIPLLAVGIFRDVSLVGDIASLDVALNGIIGQLIADKEITGKQNEITVIHTFGKIPARRTAIVGLGERKDFNADKARQASAIVAQKARELRIERYAIAAVSLGEAGIDIALIASAIAEGALLGLYKYDQFKRRREEPEVEIREMVLIAPTDAADRAQQGAIRGETVARAANLARDLSNGPPNLVTPQYLAETARSIAERLNVACEVFDVEELRRRKMGGILAVGEGSAHPPCLICLRYHGSPANDKSVAVVGKGITFDSGGLDIKSADGMLKMKHDMSGAAAVLGFIQAVAELKAPINALGIVAAAENLPSDKAYRPGDIITTYSGKTVEITSTDAEGRMVLADALTYAREQKAAAIVDLATLTGACVVALGTVASGIIGNDQSMIAMMEKAAQRSGERVWQLPLWSEYSEQLKSDVADMQNTGGRWAGAITAACFLSEFVGDIPWVHVDIAGTAYIAPGDQPYLPKDRPYLPQGATGVGVRLLVEFVEQWMTSR